MEAYLSTINDSLKQYADALSNAYAKCGASCSVYIPAENSEYIMEVLKKVSRLLNPSATVTFTQDWDDEFSIKATMTIK